ncbi:MAG TPA: flagellar basal body P-ring formation chaperone FlgA [Falsiroseomonas sp.]|jgi:flagella basal body P-ring formation protein FlgA|nr:flagellar basal body P-ring formation chaperone FlgA [Falsiroseomonas sp.]
MRILLLLLLAFAAPARAEPASLRSLAVVEAPVVLLSDLFDNLGPSGEKVLGPSPPPGTRLVVEAPQLLAIARANRVAWRPAGGSERVVIERPGRALAREEVLLTLRGALRDQGLEDGMDLDIPGFTPPMVPEGAFVRVVVEGATLDADGGRFAATLALLAEGMPTQRLRLAGRVVETVPMLVAARRMSPGEVVRARDVRLIQVPASRLRPGAAQAMDGVVGQALRRPAAAEQPMMLADLSQPATVERGQTVTMLYEGPGIMLTAQGRALDSAARGTPVPVMNLSSRVVVQAEVVAPGRVRVGGAR